MRVLGRLGAQKEKEGEEEQLPTIDHLHYVETEPMSSLHPTPHPQVAGHLGPAKGAPRAKRGTRQGLWEFPASLSSPDDSFPPEVLFVREESSVSKVLPRIPTGAAQLPPATARPHLATRGRESGPSVNVPPRPHPHTPEGQDGRCLTWLPHAGGELR